MVRGSQALLVDGAPYTETFRASGADASEVVVLGVREGVRWGARAVPAGEAETLEADSGGRFDHLRTAIATIPAWQAGLLAYAAGLLAWHERSRFCGVCGAPADARHSGHRRVCSDPECGAIFFPRTDPAMITLVRRGERALLARQPTWTEGMLSTLAGFVEPGESLEQAVAREVAEEVGLPVVETRYHASQPWPFPHTLMIGYRTEVGDGEVVLGYELEEARWFTREELRDAIGRGTVVLPLPLALSRTLIDSWLEEA